MSALDELIYFDEKQCDTDVAREILRLNEIIAEQVFSLDNSGVPVHLDLDDEVLSRLASEAGYSSEKFVEHLVKTVTSISKLRTPASVFKSFGDATRRWTNLNQIKGELGHGLRTPPSISLLAVLAYAAEQMRHSSGSDEAYISSSNYYSRLCSVVNCGWTVADTQREYRKHAVKLWESLAEWLDEWQDERGACTVVFPDSDRRNAWAIQMPISQALLRTTDKENLYQLFQSRGLDPGVPISREMMSFILEEWCGTYGTRHLKDIWKKQEYRTAMVAAAQNALMAWPGREEKIDLKDQAKTTSNIRLMLEINSFTSRVDIGVEIFVPNNNLPDFVNIETEDGHQFSLQVWAGGPRTVRILDTSAFEPDSLITGIMKISNEEIGLKSVRYPRPIVVLETSQFGRSYSEVSNVYLGRRYGLLVRDDSGVNGNLVEKVSAVLEDAARPGWKVIHSDALQGLPDGWSLFEDVELITYPDFKSDDGTLRVLGPTEIESLLLSDGFRIPGRRERWLVDLPPVVTVIVPNADDVTVVVTDSTNTVRGTFNSPSTVVVVRLADLCLASGSYLIRADSTNGKSISTTVHLVEADTPNPASLDVARALSHSITVDNAFSVLSASSGNREDSNETVIRGMYLSPLESLPMQKTVAEENETIPTSPSWSIESKDDLQNEERLFKIAAAPPESCVYGAHYWRMDNGAKYVNGICKWCNLTRLHRNFPKLRSEFKSSTRVKKDTVSTPKVVSKEVVQSIVPIPTKTSGMWDHSFAAMCYLRHGSTNDLVQIASQVDAGSIGLDRLVRAFSALGHIDVRLDDRCRPIAWSVSPAVLVATTSSEGYLAGFRSDSMIAAISQNVNELGGTIVFFDLPNAPRQVRIILPTSVDISRSVEGVIDPIRSEMIHVQRDASHVLLPNLPSISQVASDSPEIRLPVARQINKWDGRQARWKKVDDALSSGAYQNIGNGYVYTFNAHDITPSSYTKSGTAASVKHMESMRDGVSLVFYDRVNQTLSARLGAELPGLFARGVVACSGRTPHEDENARLVTYHGVDPLTASMIYDLLRK